MAPASELEGRGADKGPVQLAAAFGPSTNQTSRRTPGKDRTDVPPTRDPHPLKLAHCGNTASAARAHLLHGRPPRRTPSAETRGEAGGAGTLLRRGDAQSHQPAHRFQSPLMPPKAARNGATGVELDLEFSADGVPILMHDDTVDRTTDGFGSLTQYTYSELKKLNPAAKHRLRQQFSDETIPTLREAVIECLQYNLTIYFDVKGHAKEATAVLTDIYMEFPRLYNISIVCSFEPQVIYLMRKSDINVVTALTHRPWFLSHFGDGKPRFTSTWKHYFYMFMDILLDWSLHNILWNLCGISAFLMQKTYVSETYVKEWLSRGVEVVAWTINDFSEKSYYETILQSNYITDSLLENCSPEF